MKKKEIRFNTYENAVFSALYPFPFMHRDIMFQSIEHMYQYYKLDPSEVALRAKIIGALDPYKAKYFGSKKAGGREKKDHLRNRISLMKTAIKLCYDQNPLRQKLLLETGNATLVHEASWDDFWGNHKGKGQNQFGILLMNYRDSLK